MGNHEFIRQAKKKAMAGMTVTACGFALLMLQGNMTASAAPVTAKDNTQTLNVASEDHQASTVANSQANSVALTASAVQSEHGSNASSADSSAASNATSSAASSANSAASSAASSANSGSSSAASSAAPVYDVRSIANNQVTNFSASLADNGSGVAISAVHSATFNNFNSQNEHLYQYAILYDQTVGQKLARQRFTYDERNINYTFNLANHQSNSWKSDTLFVIFRYATDPSGNPTTDHPYVDVNSQTFNFLRETATLPSEIDTNYGWFDHINFTKDGVHVTGWNALHWKSNDHARELNGTLHHFIQILDANGNVLSSVEVTNNDVKSRTDVQKVYPSFYNSVNSGYDVTVPLTDSSAWNNDVLSARSVYTTATTPSQITSTNSVFFNSDDTNVSGGHGTFTRFQATNLPQGEEMGHLDNVTFKNGRLHVEGWNGVTWPSDEVDASHLHHYLIVYDRTTGRQLAVKEVTNTSRPDVARVNPNLYDAANTGFSTDFDIDSPAWANDVLAIVSRYSTYAGGNGDDGYADHKADWWTPGFYANKGNFAYLDGANLNGTTLTVHGWHAASISASEPNHFIIIYDRTKGQQLAVAKLGKSNVQQRLDVGNVYPGVYNADNSGFTVKFSATSNDWYNDELQVVSRLSSHDSGNGDIGQGGYTDYWFSPFKLTANQNFVNQYHFDNMSLAGGALHVTGWHLTSLNDVMNHQLIILHDDTTNHNTAVVDVSEGQSGYVLRSDISQNSAYANIQDAAKSGFSLVLANADALQYGHHYTVISRRCASTKDNGTDGAYFDASTSFDYNQHAHWIDSINFGQNEPLSVSGWMASDASNQAKNAYVIILSSGKELGRAKVTLTPHGGVEAQYPMIANSNNSGFSVTFNGQNGTPQINANQNNLTVVLRYTNDSQGNVGSVNDDVAWINYYGYDMNANAINRYILNNHIGHANITEHIVVGPRNEQQARNFDGADMHYYNNKPTMVIVHETANPNDSIWGEINYEQQNWQHAFVHTFVDDNNIINIANTNYAAWGAAYPANGYGVQFEQVEVHNGPAFARELVNAAYYTAYIMKEYGMEPSLAQPNRTGTLWSHHNVSMWMGGTDHTDPDGYWTRNANQFFGTNYTMSDFLQLVKYELSQL